VWTAAALRIMLPLFRHGLQRRCFPLLLGYQKWRCGTSCLLPAAPCLVHMRAAGIPVPSNILEWLTPGSPQLAPRAGYRPPDGTMQLRISRKSCEEMLSTDALGQQGQCCRAHHVFFHVWKVRVARTVSSLLICCLLSLMHYTLTMMLPYYVALKLLHVRRLWYDLWQHYPYKHI